MTGPVVRYVFARLQGGEDRETLAARLRATLGEAATVGVPADASAARWDLAIAIRCVDLAAWHALAATPEVTAALADLAARAVVVKAWTFTG